MSAPPTPPPTPAGPPAPARGQARLTTNLPTTGRLAAVRARRATDHTDPAAAAAAHAADIADRLRAYAARVRTARPNHGGDAVVGVRVVDLEALLADHARLTAATTTA